MIESSLDQARRFILETQGLRSLKPSKSIMSVIKKIHNVQIDTISVVSRSHNLIVYNRFPKYKEGDIWKYLRSKKLFEFWSHSLCLLPIETYPFYARKMKYNRNTANGYYAIFGMKMKDVVKKVYQHAKKNGITSSSDFKGKSLGWGGSLESRSLQYLHYTGQIMIAYRKNFQKFYDLTERVLPSNIDSNPMEDSELARFTVEITIGALGLGNQQDIRTYLGRWPAQFLWNGRKLKINEYLDEHVSEGNLECVEIRGVKDHYYILSKNIKRLNDCQETSPNEIVKLLSPFDNIIRERHFPLSIWNFDYKLEAYVPPSKRIYGYHLLPILDGCDIVGRVDVKVHRNENRMDLIALYLENNFWKTESGLERLVKGIREFSDFHNVEEIALKKVSPKSAKSKLLEHLTS